MRGMRLHDPYVFEISIFKCSATFCKWSPPTCELLTHPKLEPFLQLPVFWSTKYGQFIMHKTGVMPAALRHLEAGLTPPLTGKCSTQKGPVFPTVARKDCGSSPKSSGSQDISRSLESFRSQNPIWLELFRVEQQHLFGPSESHLVGGWRVHFFWSPAWWKQEMKPIRSFRSLVKNTHGNISQFRCLNQWILPISSHIYHVLMPCFGRFGHWKIRDQAYEAASNNSGDHPNPDEMDVGQNGKAMWDHSCECPI